MQLAELPELQNEFMDDSNVAIDIFFMIDIFVQFNLAVQKGEKGYYGDTVELVTDRHEIATTYLRGWFVVDMAAISPLFIFFYQHMAGIERKNSGSLLKLIKAFRLPRLFRLLRIFRVLRTLNMRSKEMQVRSPNNNSEEKMARGARTEECRERDALRRTRCDKYEASPPPASHAHSHLTHACPRQPPPLVVLVLAVQLPVQRVHVDSGSGHEHPHFRVLLVRDERLQHRSAVHVGHLHGRE